MKFAGKWKELEDIILSKVTQTQTNMNEFCDSPNKSSCYVRLNKSSFEGTVFILSVVE
ncbi:hypothetical protein STEG23_030769, partial [Scotinomys teguina]